MKRGKKYRAASEKIESDKLYELEQAAVLVKETAFARFDEKVELSVALNLKKSHTVRNTVVLPHQFGESKRVLVFARGEKAKEAEEAGAAYVGAEDLVEKIKGGWLDFDVCVATPDMMKDVGKLGPVLGRKGLMPNPKTQTVTVNVKEALAALQKGQTEYRADKTGVVHIVVGLVSFEADKVKENVSFFLDVLLKRKPADLKGDFVKSLSLASTMGPGVKVDTKGLF